MCVCVCVYQVLDVYPLPGMVVTPTEGVVPVGGQAEVQVHLNPGAVMKFDTRVEVKETDTQQVCTNTQHIKKSLQTHNIS